MTALPPLPERAVALSPPGAPFPPTAVTRTELAASPVLPDWAAEPDVAPEFALDTAAPVALALPVCPEFPLSPERASAFTLTLPLMAVFDADTLLWTSPVRPVEPELPETATGLDVDVDDAAPVLPVLVDDDWAVAAPESPVIVDGETSILTDPPEPPLADTTAIESPPLTRA